MSGIPTNMRIVEAPTPGGPEALVVTRRAVPSPATGELLIQVVAAGLNRADVLQRQGKYPPPPGAPSWPGLEVSGRVAAIGADVTGFAVGDRVCALVQGGGYAEYAIAPAGQTLPIPRGIDDVAAAALPEAYFTVWSNVYGFGRLQAGESLLVHGGTSGIGTAAIQLARARGSTVYATAGTPEKCRYCESLGAARGIDYRTEDFVAVLRELTTQRGVDVILDMVGGEYTARNVDALAQEGRLVIIATQGGVKSTVNLMTLMSKRAIVTGSTLRPRPVSFKAQVKTELLAHVWPLIEAGRIKPIVEKVFPLEAAGDAHRLLESSTHKGKILLQV